MIFDAAKAAGWVKTNAKGNGPALGGSDMGLAPGTHRLDHVGFGVVCGDDGKRFKTRSSETVKLIDLLNAAKDRMFVSLEQRSNDKDGTSYVICHVLIFHSIPFHSIPMLKTTSSCFVLFCLVLSCFALLCLALSCFALLCCDSHSHSY
jgi:hypothetical protein